MTESPGYRAAPLGEAKADELGDLLAKLGLDDREASVLSFLAHRTEGRSSEIEDNCSLRQPQVSQATTSLEERGWIETGTEKTPGKGRPVNVYSLNLALAEIVEEITARRREEINRDLARIERAQNLVRGTRTTEEPEEAPTTKTERSQGQG